MFTSRLSAALAFALGASLVAAPLLAKRSTRAPEMRSSTRSLGLGTPVAANEIRAFFAVAPDGHDLPPGSGTPGQGAEVYATMCASCHGEHLEGLPDPPLGGPALIGGRGSLAGAAPLKTVESYWPYATTLFDYTKRAMPFTAPGSLSDDEVYSVVAYILAEAKIIAPATVVDKTTLPRIEMPNKNGFVPDPRPETYR